MLRAFLVCMIPTVAADGAADCAADGTCPDSSSLRSPALTWTQLIAEWLRVGYCQGNMNSDNSALGGVTLDYGPFGFMERFNPVWNPWVGGGMPYCFGKQPQASSSSAKHCSTATLLPSSLGCPSVSVAASLSPWPPLLLSYPHLPSISPIHISSPPLRRSGRGRQPLDTQRRLRRARGARGQGGGDRPGRAAEDNRVDAQCRLPRIRYFVPFGSNPL